VVGSPNSSNSNRLRELAERCGARAYLIDDASMIDRDSLSGVRAVGVTAGASAPELLVTGVVEALRSYADVEVKNLQGEPENITFSLPKALRIPAQNID